MTEKSQQEHDAEIVDQFSKQAIPFAQKFAHLDAVQMLIEMSGVTEADTVLDVACGPGLVACEFARVTRHVTGLDLTPQMIEQARKRQADLGLGNITWDLGTALPLPYEPETFSAVITRYTFHHFLDPQAILSEMCRVCKPGGVVLVADPALPSENVDGYNRAEKLRDPSHTRALSYDEWEGLIGQSGLKDLRRGSYRVEMELERQLAASFPNPGDADKLRDMLRNDIGVNALGMDAHWSGNEIHFALPISVYAGNK